MKFDRKTIHQMISFETCFTLFCVSLFLYQAVSLLTEYYQGKTVVRIELGHLFEDSPPGITICPAGLNLEKIATMNERYKKMYHEHISIHNNYPEKEYFDFIKIYYDMVNQDIMDGKVSFSDILKNYTYDYKEEIRKYKLIFEFIEVIDLDDKDQTNEKLKNDSYSLNILEPIESYSLETWFLYKCLTYFSDLDTNWKNQLRNLIKFRMVLDLNKLKHFNNFMAVKIALHSPNDIPIIQTGSCTKLTRNFIWELRYNTIKNRTSWLSV